MMTTPSPDLVPTPALRTLKVLQEAGYQAYLVGGCVRDSLLEKTPKDWDIATAALPAQVQSLFPKVLPTGIQHGTVTVFVEDQGIEVTTYRTEGSYQDGRRPETVEFQTEIQADLGRRDFTINAMAWNPLTDELVDPFGGQADLQAKTIRAVGDPDSRFAEDGLRCLRAIRFASVLGFSVAQPTLQAIPNHLDTFKLVSMERIQAEFTKILLSQSVESGLQRLIETGLYQHVLPDLKKGSWPTNLDQLIALPELRLTALWRAHPVTVTIAGLRRLLYPTVLIETVAHFQSHYLTEESNHWTPTQAREWLSRVGGPYKDGRGQIITMALDLALFLHPQSLPGVQQVHAILWTNPPLSIRDLALNGDQIMRILNLKPSPKVGEITRALLNLVLAEPEKNTPADLTQFLRDHYGPTTRQEGRISV
jgi:tRNA nucleotidyltransferase (CCA-adding enzyme)